MKLASELQRVSTEILYGIDEPTTGLHTDDIARLEVLNRLNEAGSTVLVVEHNLDVIKTADYIIDADLKVVAVVDVLVGTPEEVAKDKNIFLQVII